MFIPFSKLPDHSRVWIYQANRIIEAEVRSIIEEQLISFTSSWVAHGHPLQSSFILLDDYFIVLAVDEQIGGASGCSIDSSTNAMKQIAEITGLDFFDRKIVAFEIDQEVKQLQLGDLKQKFKDGVLDENTITFNTLADSVGVVRKNWRIPVKESWVKRYIQPRTFDSVSS
jgi:hypothetical protein